MMQIVRKWKTAACQKVVSTQAETLAELLVSVLVISLGLAMFATALMSARRMLQLGDAAMQTYYEERNLLDLEADEAKESALAEVVLEKGTRSINLGAPQSNLRTGHQKKGRYSVQLYAEKQKDSGADASENGGSKPAASGTRASQNEKKNYRYQWIE